MSSLSHEELWCINKPTFIISSSPPPSSSYVRQARLYRTYTLEISKYFVNYLVLDRWHAVTLGSMVDIIGYSPNLFLLPPGHRVSLHVPGTLEVSVAIGPGCSTWNVKRNDRSYLQAWPIKMPNCHLLCLSSQVNDLGTHIWKMEKLQDGRSLSSLIITWKRTSH